MLKLFQHLKFCLLLLLTFFIASPVFAQNNIVINEFLPNPSGPSSEPTEWIELYNTNGSKIDISGWKLDDIEDGGTNPYTIPDGTEIEGNGFLVFEREITKVALNNSGGDTVRLLNQTDSLVDSYSYNNTTEDYSYGRSQDGDSQWIEFQNPTKGRSNSGGSPLLPTATPTSMPTSTPKPTATPKTPTKTPTPMVTESLIKAAQDKGVKQQDYGAGEIINDSDLSRDSQDNFDYLDRILSTATESGLATASSSPTATPSAQLRSMIGKLFLFLGVLSLIAMVASAVYVEKKKGAG